MEMQEEEWWGSKGENVPSGVQRSSLTEISGCCRRRSGRARLDVHILRTRACADLRLTLIPHRIPLHTRPPIRIIVILLLPLLSGHRHALHGLLLVGLSVRLHLVVADVLPSSTELSALTSLATDNFFEERETKDLLGLFGILRFDAG